MCFCGKATINGEARLVLVTMAQKAGLDPSALPAMPDFGNLGVF